MPHLYLKLLAISLFLFTACGTALAQQPLHLKHSGGKTLFLAPGMLQYQSIGFAGKNMVSVMATQPQAYPVFIKYRKLALLKNISMAMRLGGAGLMITSFFLTPKTGGTFNYDLYNENSSHVFGTGFILTATGMLSFIPISILANIRLKKSVKLYNHGAAAAFEVQPVLGITGGGHQNRSVPVLGAKVAF
ncbi:hypothetical protein C7N43_19870 [Sphingobacteriales bacterium UPWRP_1]|nr:hypothetical protein BVG80_02590 [Sphingobacteriales bacterium TSM_CSM]PSJ75245.1 hypothetical protein C7N43_19870 [Sphingobacteriales bacterium UPWRP_1]